MHGRQEFDMLRPNSDSDTILLQPRSCFQLLHLRTLVTQGTSSQEPPDLDLNYIVSAVCVA